VPTLRISRKVKNGIHDYELIKKLDNIMEQSASLEAYENVAKKYGFTSFRKFTISPDRDHELASDIVIQIAATTPTMMLYTDDIVSTLCLCRAVVDESDKYDLKRVAQFLSLLPPMYTFVFRTTDRDGVSTGTFTSMLQGEKDGSLKLDNILKNRGRHDTDCAICFEKRGSSWHCDTCTAIVCADCCAKDPSIGCPVCRRSFFGE